MKYKVAITAFIIGFSPIAFNVDNISYFTTYISGSENVPHDVELGDMVNGDVVFGSYCHLEESLPTNVGDVVFYTRADSLGSCNFNTELLNWIAIMGVDSNDKFIGDEPKNNAIVISNGHNWGLVIDYYIPESSLSFAMPAMANIILEVNNSRIKNGQNPYNTLDMKYVLDNSSNETYVVDEKYYGQIIDLDNAIEISKTYKAVNKKNIDFMIPIIQLLIL